MWIPRTPYWNLATFASLFPDTKSQTYQTLFLFLCCQLEFGVFEGLQSLKWLQHSIVFTLLCLSNNLFYLSLRNNWGFRFNLDIKQKVSWNNRKSTWHPEKEIKKFFSGKMCHCGADVCLCKSDVSHLIFQLDVGPQSVYIDWHFCTFLHFRWSSVCLCWKKSAKLLFYSYFSFVVYILYINI